MFYGFKLNIEMCFMFPKSSSWGIFLFRRYNNYKRGKFIDNWNNWLFKVLQKEERIKLLQ